MSRIQLIIHASDKQLLHAATLVEFEVGVFKQKLFLPIKVMIVNEKRYNEIRHISMTGIETINKQRKLFKLSFWKYNKQKARGHCWLQATPIGTSF